MPRKTKLPLLGEPGHIEETYYSVRVTPEMKQAIQDKVRKFQTLHKVKTAGHALELMLANSYDLKEFLHAMEIINQALWHIRMFKITYQTVRKSPESNINPVNFRNRVTRLDKTLREAQSQLQIGLRELRGEYNAPSSRALHSGQKAEGDQAPQRGNDLPELASGEGREEGSPLGAVPEAARDLREMSGAAHAS